MAETCRESTFSFLPVVIRQLLSKFKYLPHCNTVLKLNINKNIIMILSKVSSYFLLNLMKLYFLSGAKQNSYSKWISSNKENHYLYILGYQHNVSTSNLQEVNNELYGSWIQIVNSTHIIWIRVLLHVCVGFNGRFMLKLKLFNYLFLLIIFFLDLKIWRRSKPCQRRPKNWNWSMVTPSAWGLKVSDPPVGPMENAKNNNKPEFFFDYGQNVFQQP